MTLYALKPRFQALLRPAAALLYRSGITANQVTVGTCIVSVALGVCLAANADTPRLFLLLPAWCFLRMAFNAIDGLLAREFGQRSTLGAYLNEITDAVADAALYLPFAFLPGINVSLVACIIVLAVLSEAAGVLPQARGAARRNDGPMGKSDRALVFGALGLIVGGGVTVGPWLEWTLAAIATLIVVTIAQRVLRGAAAAAAPSGR